MSVLPKMDSPGNLPAAKIRRILRTKRRALSAARQQANSKAAAGHLIRSGILLRCRSIATYQASDGEIDPSPIVQFGFEHKIKMYLPVLRQNRKQALWFVEHRPGEAMLKNRFGINEPMTIKRRCIVPWALDLMLLPLVGFDLQGNRIGMGGGYYDRTLAFLNYRKYWHRPTLIGMAHDCQRLPTIDARAWDIPLDGILSESGLHIVNKKTT